MVSSKREEKPIRLVVVPTEFKARALSMVMEQIAMEYGSESSVLLLMRQRFDISFLYDDNDWRIGEENTDQGIGVTCLSTPTLHISANTVHSTKGMEADNVVIINGENGLYYACCNNSL